jgi:membrane associated rhomboid family serine protease
MSLLPGNGPVDSLSLALLLLALAIAYLVLRREDGRVFDPLRRRFVLGVPWGTVIVIVGVWAVYQFVQGGSKPGGPVVVGFRSWSFFYPQGMLFSSFAHGSESHLFGNLVGTVLFGTAAEYVWSHYPQTRGSKTFSSWLTNPFVRILTFVLAVFVVGILASMFVPVAAIGFSSVVFAFAGMAVVTAPIAAVVALLGVQVLALLREAVLYPTPTFRTEPGFFTPSWVDTAIQGHLFGFVVGVLVGIALLSYRDQFPSLRYVFFAALVFLVTRSMEAVYIARGGGEFVLYRALGTAGVIVLATAVALLVTERNRAFVPRPSVSVRTVAVGLLLVVLCSLALTGVAFNLVSVTNGDAVEGGIDVRDYTVMYAENAENQYIADSPLPDFLTPPPAASGVIITSEQREAWVQVASAREFAAEGRRVIALGDATWREVVVVSRTAWTFVDGNETYKVFGNRAGTSAQQLFASGPANASVIINGTTVAIEPTPESYALSVSQNGTVLGQAPVPEHNQTVEIADITFERDQNSLIARYERTEIEFARYRVGGTLQDVEQ